MELVGLPENTNGEDLEELAVKAKTKRTTQEFNQNNKNKHKSTKIYRVIYVNESLYHANCLENVIAS